MRQPIDYYAIMQNIPEILGMEMNWKKDAWEGRYYINGERHAYKRDKLKVKMWRGGIWLHEQGGNSMSLITWLVTYGGCVDEREAIKLLRGHSTVKDFVISDFRQKQAEIRYVTEEEYLQYIEYELERSSLYGWMCRNFGEERVRHVWERYRVTTNQRGDVVFWYLDVEGRICHDKIVRYKFDGHRDKAFGGSRVYTTAEGYGGRCLYGAHLIPEKGDIWLCESEKSALICACVWPEKVFVATGGKNGLRDLDSRVKLLPDIDAVEEWQSRAGLATVVEWWKNQQVREKEDIADLIMRKIKAGEDARGILG